MIKKLIYLFIFFVRTIPIMAQEPQPWGVQLISAGFKAKQVIPPTPEAAALGKYGNVPVSLFTGTPTINIPLYQLSGNNISLPVNLTYNAGGFNPQEIATWVGLGWSLNAGGVVTRSVMGNPDGANYFRSPSPLIIPGQFTDPFAYADYMDNLRKGYIEAQPDVYYYNFAGHSGKFFVNPDFSILKKEKNNYQITAALGANTGSFISITDDQGVRYEFMESELSTMTPDDGGGIITTYTYPSTWYLTKIISADGYEEIGFTYYTTSLEHTQFNNLSQNESDTYEQTQYATGVSSITGPSAGGSVSPTVKTKRKYLQQITFKKAGQLLSYIDFISTVDQRQDLDHSTSSGFPGERLLTSIQVYTKNTPAAFALIKQYNMNYSYFLNNTLNYKRLRLDNVQEIPSVAGTSQAPPYTFTYNDDNLMPGYSGGVDHWGFYNGGTTYHRLVPSTEVTPNSINITATNREPSISGYSYLINKMTYPTGGYTSFEYELNKAKGSSYVGTPEFNVGGARIKKITDFSFTAKKAVEKNYQYTLDDGSSSGRAMMPSYSAVIQFTSYGGSTTCSQDFISKITTTTVSASSNAGLGTVQGSHIGYSKVTELVTDVSNGQPLGKTVFDYYVRDGDWNVHDDDIGNGDLLKKTVYDNQGKLIEETSNTFNYILLGAIGAVAPGVSNIQNNKNVLVKMNAPPGTFVYGWYMAAGCATNVVASKLIKTSYYNNGWSVASREKKLTEQSAKKYDQLSNAYISTTKKFTYGNAAHTLPTSIEETTNNGESVITDKVYPLDYIIPGTGTLDDNTQGIKLLRDKNIIGPEIETVQRRQNADGSNKRYISGILTNYNPAIPYSANLYRIETTSPLTSFQLSSISAGNLTYNSNYKLAGSFVYLSNGSLLEQSKNSDMPTAYIWDYNYRYPTAEIINAQNGQVAYSSFETDENGGWGNIPNISSNRVTTTAITGKYSYNLTPGNNITKTSLTNSGQFTVSYWSKNGSATVASDAAGTALLTIGATHNGWTYYQHLLPVNTIAITISSAVINNIDELRLYPKDALMTTVAYEPGTGVTSQCTPKNLITYFEYDGLNRLINVKDENANIVKNYKYNYGLGTALSPSAQTLFYNTQKQANYTKTGCPVGTEPTTETYVVQYGRYVSSINQADADAKAITDVTNNGQAYAQSVGKCLYWNTVQTLYFSKNDCLPEQGSSKCSNSGPVRLQDRIAYTVPAHTYSSELNQGDADQKALNEISANGQAYANSYCWCNCGGVGQKIVNGICETGTRYNSSTSQQANGTWICYFYYVFSDGSFIEYSEVNATACPIQ